VFFTDLTNPIAGTPTTINFSIQKIGHPLIYVERKQEETAAEF
jgi:hypothetical protein